MFLTVVEAPKGAKVTGFACASVSLVAFFFCTFTHLATAAAALWSNLRYGYVRPPRVVGRVTAIHVYPVKSGA